MTLTIDEVRNIRFPMARQPNEDGYRASAVDNFVDRLEVAYAALVDENDQLKTNSAKGIADVERSLIAERDSLTARVDVLRRELTQARGDIEQARAQARAAEAAAVAIQVPPSPDEGLLVANGQLSAANASLGNENEVLRAQLSQVQTQLVQVQAQLSQVQAEADLLRDQPPPPPPAVDNGLADQLNATQGEVTRLQGEAKAWQAQVQDLQEQLGAAQAQAEAALQAVPPPPPVETPEATPFAVATSGVAPALVKRPQVGEDGVQRITVTTSAEAAQAAVMLVEQAVRQAHALLAEAETQAQARRDDATLEARQVIETATQQAEEIGAKATDEADRIKCQARVVAEKISAQAAAQVNQLDCDVAERRRENLAQLEHDRSVLADRIGQMRDFEVQYRAAMAAHLQRQLDSLTGTQFAPTYRPEVVDAAAPAAPVATPRLDALIREDSSK